MKKLSRLLKSSPFLYSVYFYSMSFLLRLLGLFFRVDDKLILFNCFGGKKYDDSPKAIYEAMLMDERFADYTLVWALKEPDKNVIPGRAKVVKSDSFKYFRVALKAKVWITNSSMERGLSFKKRKTLCFNTWHGTAIKALGLDLKKENMSFRSKILVRADMMLAQGQYDIDIFSRAFDLPKESFFSIGLPRNDVLAKYTNKDVNRIKEKLGIDEKKTVLLYAPTFRESATGSNRELVLNIPMNPHIWQERLGKDFIVLFRAHYEVASYIKIQEFPLFIDVSDYPHLDELMIVSDALISDYSSIFFDYSIMPKPMYCFAYDYEDYVSSRGMYIELKEELPCQIHRDEGTLIDDLLSLKSKREETVKKTAVFREKYVTEYGNASEKSCDIVQQWLAKEAVE